MNSALGDACLSPVTIDVVRVADDNWLVRTRYLDGPPTNHISISDRERANNFATELRDVTSEMAIKLNGFPANLELAEAPDETAP